MRSIESRLIEGRQAPTSSSKSKKLGKLRSHEKALLIHFYCCGLCDLCLGGSYSEQSQQRRPSWFAGHFCRQRQHRDMLQRCCLHGHLRGRSTDLRRDETSLNTKLSLNPGDHKTVVQEWDRCGGSSFTAVPLTVTTASGVFVTSPANNSTVGSPVRFSATAATSTCPKGVASIGIYTAPSPDKKVYVTQGDSLNTTVSLSPGTLQHCGAGVGLLRRRILYAGHHHCTVDTCGGSETRLTNVQARKGWRGWGELAPKLRYLYDCQPEVTCSMTQTGGATTFHLGGTKPYSDVLWSYPMVGPASVLGFAGPQQNPGPEHSRTSSTTRIFFPAPSAPLRSWSLTSVNISAGKVSFMAPSAGSPADMHGTSGTT